ncbi:MAG: cyclase [Chloroflexi bacterium]|nr:cyclase [Chloroflexota bacterium]
MPHLLVKLTLEDYARWKPVFDEYAALRKTNGSQGGHLFQNASNPNEVFILFEWDPEKSKAYFGSEEVKAAMQRAGVTGRELVFLTEVEHLSA